MARASRRRADAVAILAAAINTQFGKLAVKGGTPDAEPPRDFAHLSTIMADGHADNVGFQLIKWSDVAIRLEKGDPLVKRGFARCPARLVRRKYTAKMGDHTCLDQIN